MNRVLLFLLSFTCSINSMSSDTVIFRGQVIKAVKDTALDNISVERTVTIQDYETHEFDSFKIYKYKLDFWPDTLSILDVGDTIDFVMVKYNWAQHVSKSPRHFYFYNHILFEDSLKSIPLINTYKISCRDRRKLKYIPLNKSVTYKEYLYKVSRISCRFGQMKKLPTMRPR